MFGWVPRWCAFMLRAMIVSNTHRSEMNGVKRRNNIMLKWVYVHTQIWMNGEKSKQQAGISRTSNEIMRFKQAHYIAARSLWWSTQFTPQYNLLTHSKVKPHSAHLQNLSVQCLQNQLYWPLALKCACLQVWFVRSMKLEKRRKRDIGAMVRSAVNLDRK